MRYKLFFIALPILLSFLSCSNHRTGKKLKQVNNIRENAAFRFKEDFHDFGKIKDGDTVSHDFSFINTGKAPLLIQDISTSCGCTAVAWTDKPIPPQASGHIAVQFTKHHDPGVHVKQIIIKANTADPYTVIHIKAVVKG